MQEPSWATEALLDYVSAKVPFRELHPGMGQAVAERTILRKLSTKDGHILTPAEVRTGDPFVWETWGQVASRVAAGNCALVKDCPVDEYRLLRDGIANGSILMSGRHLQHGDLTQPGRTIEAFSNCLDGETELPTLEQGVAKLKDLVGQTVTIRSGDGTWRSAVIHHHGQQEVCRYRFSQKGMGSDRGVQYEVVATADHRWLLRDGSVTQNLQVGDDLLGATPGKDSCPIGVVHGLIFGDGSIQKSHRVHATGVVAQGREYVGIRVCKQDAVQTEIHQLLDAAGFSYTTPPHASGDRVYYLGRTPCLKDLPFTTDPSYIRGFLRGWWLADGSKTVEHAMEISTTRQDAVDWLMRHACYAGYVVTMCKRLDRAEGDGSFANGKPLFTIRLRESATYRVVSIDAVGIRDVYCPEEPVTGAFVLANGLLTGNCSSAATSFLSFYLLLNGSGVGRCFDDDICVVNWDYAPNIRCVLSEEHADFDYSAHESARDARHKYGTGKNVLWHEVADTREGWAKALEIWEAAAFQERHANKLLVLDFSKVRCKGSPIRGMQNRPASGPVPIMNAFEKAARIKGAGLEPWLQSLFVDHYFSECVLVGGARRAARSASKHWKDPGIFEFIRIKRAIEFQGLTPDQVKEFRKGRQVAGLPPVEGFLWSANNSIGVDPEFWELCKLSRKDERFNTPEAKHARKVIQVSTECSYGDGSGEPGALNLHRLVRNDEGMKGFEAGDFVGSPSYSVEPETKILLQKLAKRVSRKMYTYIPNPCQPAWATVLTPDGIKTFGDIDVGSVIWSGKRWTTVVDKWSSGVKPTFAYRTPAGTFHGTADHRVLCGGTRVRVGDAAGIDAAAMPNQPLDTVPRTYVIRDVSSTGDHEVFDITVDDPEHTYWTGGLLVSNCFEVTLLILGAFCIIASIVPLYAEGPGEAEQAVRATTRSLIRVNRMPAIYQKEVQRTNRIAVGLVGLHELAWARFGLTFYDLLDESKSQAFWDFIGMLRRAVADEAEKYSKQLGMPVPHTDTAIMPAGTIAKLRGLTEGAHLPPMKEYLRWVQFRNDDPLIKVYEQAGYPIKQLKTYDGTTIVGFPTSPAITEMMPSEKIVTAAQATPEEQYRWVQLLEKYWIIGVDAAGQVLQDRGNQVSFCLAGSKQHLVTTSAGLQRIETAVPSSTQNRYGESQQIIDTVVNGKCPVMRVRLKNGAEIIGTGDHKLLTVAEDLSFVWKAIRDISIRDVVVRRLGNPASPTKLAVLPPTPEAIRCDGRRGNLTAIKTPPYATCDFGEFLGMLMSDGCLYRNGVSLTTADKLVAEHFLALSHKLFGVTGTLKVSSINNVLQTPVNSRLLMRWLLCLGIPPYHDDNAIPEVILQSPPEVQLAFLRGYTLDGYVTSRTGLVRVCSTTSRIMAKDLAAMLWSLGLDASLGYAKGRPYFFSDTNKGLGRPQWTVRLGLDDSRRFAALAGFSQKEKTARASHAALPRMANQFNAVPAASFRQFARANRAKYTTAEWRVLRGFVKGTCERISLALVQRYFCDESFCQHLLDPMLRFTAVTSISDAGMAETFDLTVDVSHEYVANGVVVHNTLKYDPEVVDYKSFRDMYLKYQPTIKCCAVMPQEDVTSYEYQPEQPLPKAEYEQIVRGIRRDAIRHIGEDVGKEHIDCAGGVCPVNFEVGNKDRIGG